MDEFEFKKAQEEHFRRSMSPHELETFRKQALSNVVRYVRNHSKFYRQTLRDTASEVGLESLPFTTKSDLQSHGLDLLAKSISEAQVYYETTGTTGNPTPCPRDWLDVSTSNVPVVESWRSIFNAVLGEEEKPVVALMGPSELYAFGDTFTDAARELGVAHVKLWPESNRVGYKNALRLLHELKVNVVVCAPALALSLAKAAKENGWSRDDFDIRAFLVLGEICTPAMSQNIKSLWSAETYNILYGSQECHAVATGCSAQRMHLSETNYIFELIDDDGKPVPPAPGSHGELTLTMLVPGMKPLIRFRTGDQATISEETCDCGLPGRTLTIHGRKKDKVLLGEQYRWPGEVEKLVLSGLRGVYGYTVFVNNENQSEVRIELEIDHDLISAEECAQTMVKNFAKCGVKPTVTISRKMDPLNSAGSYIGWKAARIRRDDPSHTDERDFASIAYRYETSS